MTDNEEVSRPNANYNLSKPDGKDARAEGELIFYYNRENRLKKAPQSVRDLYANAKPYRFSLIRPLIADKRRAILFFTILIMCAFIFLFSKMGYFDSSYSLEGNKIDITAAKHEGVTLIIMKKARKKDVTDAYSGAVGIAVSPAVIGDNEEMPVFFHRVFFTLEPSEEYRFVVPFNDPDLLMVLQTEKSTLKARIKSK